MIFHYKAALRIWLAATALATGARLLTRDAHFNAIGGQTTFARTTAYSAFLNRGARHGYSVMALTRHN